MATAVLCSRVRKGSARPFIGVGEGEGELGASLLGRVVLGQARMAVAARPAMAVTVAGDGAGRARGELGGRQQGAVPRKPGARELFWAEARRVGRPGGFAGVRRRRGRGAGRRRWKNRSVAIS